MYKHFLLIIFFLLAISACSSFKQWQHMPISKDDEKNIYLLNNGWHSSLVIPTKYLDVRFSFLSSYFGESQYYEFGWGDEDFYPAQENSLLLGLKAMLWPTSTLIHVVAVPFKPEEYFISSQPIKIKISTKGMEKLLDYLNSSFKKDSNNKPISTQKGLYGRSFFFKANGYFFMTYTCNTWITQALEEAGLPVSSFLTITAESVVSQTKSAIQRYPVLP